MASDNIVKYNSRTFSEIKTDLYNYIKTAYPDLFSDFSDSTVGSMLVDINAGVTNNIHNTIDRVFQENTLSYAQQRKSIFELARMNNFKIPPKRASVTLVDISVQVPVLGDNPDSSYYPIIYAGAQIIGSGKIFETQDVVDFSSSVNTQGDVNRAIVPNYNSNGTLVSYTITKREIAINGATSIYSKNITVNESIPFYKLTLPDSNIIGIESVILVENTITSPTTSDFSNSDYLFYEVDYLAQQRIFVDDESEITDDTLKIGKWMNVTKKFITEYDENGYCSLIFGSGDNTDTFKKIFVDNGISNKYFLDNLVKNDALGVQLSTNHILYVKYKTGGGSSSNIGANVLTQFGTYQIQVLGDRTDVNNLVLKSIKVTNPIAAIGGNDGLSIEQIRYLIKYNNSSQNRNVNLNDYLVHVYKMNGRYGSPYKANAIKLNNKVVISIIGIDSSGLLDNTSNSILKENIAEYLSEYRMVNDYVEIRDGEIINLGFDVEVLVSSLSDTQIINDIVSEIKDYFNTDNWEIGSNLYLGDLEKTILTVSGVKNIISLTVYNKKNGSYSINSINQTISDTTTGEIQKQDNIIYANTTSIFEIKYPDKDIRVILKKL